MEDENPQTDLSFSHFVDFLVRGDSGIDNAKSIVTTKNVLCRSMFGHGVIWYLCTYGPDDLSLFWYFIGMGASLETDSLLQRSSCLHAATQNSKYNLMRALIEAGVSVHIIDEEFETPFVIAFEGNDEFGAKLLLDAGAVFTQPRYAPNSYNGVLSRHSAFFWLRDREVLRNACVVVLGLVQCQSTIIGCNDKNVLKLISRCMWQNRGQLQ